jgi:hypothetical protein
MWREKCVLIAVLLTATILRLSSSYELTATLQNLTLIILDMYWLATCSNGMKFYLSLTLYILWLSCGSHRQQRNISLHTFDCFFIVNTDCVFRDIES